MYLIMPTISAADYSSAETVAKNMLLDPANNLGIQSADVSISTKQVTFNCITHLSVHETGAPLAEFGAFLSGALGTYISIIKAVPEVGDLLIVMKNSDGPTTSTMICPKAWVTGLDLTNENAVNELMLKVFQTMKNA
ncbi:Uncharacterised protein [uncultured archaeon]|nr:Uncharacterised protein [uncultured archaeon]